jgi:hypothetical protein
MNRRELMERLTGMRGTSARQDRMSRWQSTPRDGAGLIAAVAGDEKW